MANPRAYENGKATRFNGDTAAMAGKKGAKASAEARRNYASWKQCFKERCTPEQMEQMYDKLWNLFYKSNNLNALEMLLKGLDDDSVRKDTSVTVVFKAEDMDEYGD